MSRRRSASDADAKQTLLHLALTRLWAAWLWAVFSGTPWQAAFSRSEPAFIPDMCTSSVRIHPRQKWIGWRDVCLFWKRADICFFCFLWKCNWSFDWSWIIRKQTIDLWWGLFKIIPPSEIYGLASILWNSTKHTSLNWNILDIKKSDVLNQRFSFVWCSHQCIIHHQPQSLFEHARKQLQGHILPSVSRN